MNSPTCPRCGSKMEHGVLVDRGHGDVARVPEWFEGEPVKSFWLGLKTKGHEHHPVRTYRCERCGYLESYAIEAERRG